MHKKNFILVLFLFSFGIIGVAQKNIPVTDFVTVSGEVSNPIRISLSDLMNFKVHEMGDVDIRNHTGEFRNTKKNVKGVLLKDVLANVALNEKSPRLYSEFYLATIASDGYKVVFSWNEIFNSPLGDKIILVVESDGIVADKMDDRILLLCLADMNTGRRHVKGLSEIKFLRL